MNRYQCSLVICGMLICYAALSNSDMPSDGSLVHQRLDQAIYNLKHHRLQAENSLEQLRMVLDAELTLIEYLQTDETGMKVEDAVNERERLLATSAPSVVHVYNLIMDVATYSPLLTSSTSYLNVHERAAYFTQIYDTLEYYYREFETMQYRNV